MDQKVLLKQMIDFNKTAFDNTFSAMTMVQEQTKKMFATMIDQNPWLPDDGKKAVQDWVDTYKKGCEDFKKMADDNFSKVGFEKGMGLKTKEKLPLCLEIFTLNLPTLSKE